MIKALNNLLTSIPINLGSFIYEIMRFYIVRYKSIETVDSKREFWSDLSFMMHQIIFSIFILPYGIGSYPRSNNRIYNKMCEIRQ